MTVSYGRLATDADRTTAGHLKSSPSDRVRPIKRRSFGRRPRRFNGGSALENRPLSRTAPLSADRPKQPVSCGHTGRVRDVDDAFCVSRTADATVHCFRTCTAPDNPIGRTASASPTSLADLAHTPSAQAGEAALSYLTHGAHAGCLSAALGPHPAYPRGKRATTQSGHAGDEIPTPPRVAPARPHYSAGGNSFRSMKDWRAPQNASRVSTAALKPALRSLMVLTKATGPAGASYANAKSAC